MFRTGKDAMKLAHARLVTSDVQALAQFYEEITGVTAIGSEDYVEFRGSDTTLAISSKRSIDLFNAGAAEAGTNRSLVLDFEVENVDEERSRLHGKVQEFVLEPTDQPWGNRSMLFRDPDGNLINFFTPIGRIRREQASSKRGVM
jgi:catechol 2,3-dioxygenase-like lactoylglutathione lyase family enzyme